MDHVSTVLRPLFIGFYHPFLLYFNLVSILRPSKYVKSRVKAYLTKTSPHLVPSLIYYCSKSRITRSLIWPTTSIDGLLALLSFSASPQPQTPGFVLITLGTAPSAGYIPSHHIGFPCTFSVPKASLHLTPAIVLIR